jgi:hypothetical protein
MRRRKLLVALAGLAVVGAAGAVVLWPPQSPNHRITVENCELMRTGMNRAEIEGISWDTTGFAPIRSRPRQCPLR